MRLKLPSGSQVQIGVKYSLEDTIKYKNLRTVTISITFEDRVSNPTLVGRSLCSPNNQFVKMTARQIALLRLFKSDDYGWQYPVVPRKMLTRQDRTVIFNKLCAHPKSLPKSDKKAILKMPEFLARE